MGVNLKEIIAVINRKGGVGKTTTCDAIGAGLTNKGYKVLYIDLDPQGNLSSSLNVNTGGLGTIDILTKDANCNDTIQKTNRGDILPSSPRLSGADRIISSVGKEYRLKEELDKIKDNYDYIIIDTPPSLGILTINALTASSNVMIPAGANIYSLEGIGQLIDTIQTVKKYCNPDLKINGILLTRYNNRQVLSREVAEMLGQTAKEIGTKLYKTYIRPNVALEEAQTSKQDIFSYDPGCNASKDYQALIEEILNDQK